MILIESHSEGAILPVRAQPGSKKNEIRGEQNGFLKVCVTQIPEKGKANKVIIDFLAKSLKIKKSQIKLLSGETSQQKKFLINCLSKAELFDLIQPFL
ncbi:MAG: DUF167 domain-containing protein [Planctomycetia bacterium]|nr:DUF167 domain-containing protein [Planctomycetia bacterium]